jgi:hypothetical protein
LAILTPSWPPMLPYASETEGGGGGTGAGDHAALPSVSDVST